MKIQEQTLFDDFVFDCQRSINTEKRREKEAYVDALHLKICDGITFTGNYQMPIVNSTTVTAPEDIMSFHRAIPGRNRNVFPHFYVSDDMLERVWNQWERYEELLRMFPAVLSPDFSMFRDMPLPLRIYNCFRNKLLAARLQKDGLLVVPNVSWSDEESLEYAVEGWPKHSVIAINSTGLGRDKKAKALWRTGYQYVVDRLEPTMIIRYGAKQPDELEEISRYYENDNLKSVRHGR